MYNVTYVILILTLPRKLRIICAMFITFLHTKVYSTIYCSNIFFNCKILLAGPFFKCDFCGIYVTDRVSHMKVAHYSPLAQAFCKTNNSYQCLQCSYTSDQLTNIRNHVDAKHGSGKNKYICEECNSEYKTLNSMRAHKSRVHVKKRRLVAQSQHIRDPIMISRNHKLQKEILESEEKTLPKFLKTCSIDL